MKKTKTYTPEEKLNKESEVRRIKRIMSRPTHPHATFEYWALQKLKP